MSDGRKRSKIECRVCKVKISFGGGSTNNLHRHIRTVHPSVQLEEKRQASEPATNEGASFPTATVAVAAASMCLQYTTATTWTYNPELYDTVCAKGCVLQNVVFVALCSMLSIISHIKNKHLT